MIKNTKPNIILIMLDAVRAKSLSCYGNPKKSSPYLDRFAETANLYKNVISPSGWSSPSLASSFTGLYESEHGTHGFELNFLRSDVALAEILKKQGYQTVSLNSCFMVSREFGFDFGFNEFIDLTQIFQQPKLKNLIRSQEFRQ